MTSTERAVRLAVGGGWRPTEDSTVLSDHHDEHAIAGLSDDILFECDKEYLRGVRVSEALLEPAFWRALGKALGWEDDGDGEGWVGQEIDNDGNVVSETKFSSVVKTVGWGGRPLWEHRWHGLLDWLAEGKTAESYLGTLLSDVKETE